MSPALSFEELRAKLAAARDRTQHGLYFAALLARGASIPTDEFFVVGGSAIEIYTVGEYTSGDIDIASSGNDRLQEVLESWHFERDGRVWVHPDLGLVVDLVRYPYTGDVERTTIMATPYGPVRVAAIEDLLVKRLISTKFWKRKEDFDQAKLLAISFSDRIDWEYVERFAREEDVSDLLALLRGGIPSRLAGRKSS